MKIPNYDPDFLRTTYCKQGHPCMPTSVFQMLICGPSNSGKTSILLHMLFNLLEYDKVYLFSKNLHQTKYRALFKTLPQKSTRKLVARSSRRQGMRLFLVKSFRWTTKRLSSLTTWFFKSNQKAIINYFINGRHKNCSFIYLTQTFYKVPRKTCDNCSHFCIFAFLPKENKRIAGELGLDHQLLNSATDKEYSFFYYDEPQKLMKLGVVQVQVGRQGRQGHKAPLGQKPKQARRGHQDPMAQ